MQLIRRIPAYAVIAILIYMPFHIFLSQSLSLITGGLTEWKVAKDVFLAALVLFTVCLVWRQGRVPKWYLWLTVFTATYGLLHIFLWALHPGLFKESAILGVTYNVRIPCFVVASAGAALLYPRAFAFRSIMRIVLVVSTVVAALGILQYFLPKDVLTHMGYSLPRGVRPNFFIDDNPEFPRIMSTLRDPNSLGAYLLLPLAALVGFSLKIKSMVSVRSMFMVSALAVHVMAIYLTFSRSAWAGALLVVGLTIWWQFSSQIVRLFKKWWPVAGALLILVGGVLFWQRDSPAVNGVITHSTAAQQGPHDSNDLHFMYARDGLYGILDQPTGHGPGSAGLVSIRDQDGGKLTENYYIQIGYEVGVLGLAMFIGLNVWVYLRIWRRHDAWTPIMLVSFWAYVVTNMLLHTWSNEAVAAQWWILAGLAITVVGPLGYNEDQ